jgi:hypothetical protein
VQEQVVIGVAAAQVEQVDGAVSQVQRVPVADELGRRCDDHLSPFLGWLLAASDPARESRPFVIVEMGGQPNVPVNRDVQVRVRPEPLIAERVVVVRVGVHHPADRLAAQLPQVGADLVGLPGRRPRVDDREAVRAADHADAHVQRVIAPLEHPLGDLVPAHVREPYRCAPSAYSTARARPMEAPVAEDRWNAASPSRDRSAARLSSPGRLDGT